MSNVTKCFLAPAFADPVILQGLHRASKYPAKQLVIHSSEHFFLRPLSLHSHTWRLQNVRLDDVGSVDDRGRRRQIAQVVNRLLVEEGSLLLMPHSLTVLKT